MPLVGGTRQRLGLPSGRWIRPDRSRSPRASGAQGGHDAELSYAETGEVELSRYVSGLYMENGCACWPWECVLDCCKFEETGPFTERCYFLPGQRGNVAGHVRRPVHLGCTAISGMQVRMLLGGPIDTQVMSSSFCRGPVAFALPLCSKALVFQWTW